MAVEEKGESAQARIFSVFAAQCPRTTFHGGCLKLFGVFLVQGIFHQPLHSCFFCDCLVQVFFQELFALLFFS